MDEVLQRTTTAQRPSEISSRCLGHTLMQFIKKSADLPTVTLKTEETGFF